MKKVLIILIGIGFITTSFAQKKYKPFHSIGIGLSTGYTYQKNHSRDFGVSINYITWTRKIGLQLNPGFSFETNFAEQLIGQNTYVGIGMVTDHFILSMAVGNPIYKDKQNDLEDNMIRPEIGFAIPVSLYRKNQFHLFGRVKLYYGYNVFVGTQSISRLSNHVFGISLIFGPAMFIEFNNNTPRRLRMPE